MQKRQTRCYLRKSEGKLNARAVEVVLKTIFCNAYNCAISFFLSFGGVEVVVLGFELRASHFLSKWLYHLSHSTSLIVLFLECQKELLLILLASLQVKINFI
jgi:hypothetical protein